MKAMRMLTLGAGVMMAMGAGAQAQPGAVATPVHPAEATNTPSPGINPTTDTMRDPADPAGPNPNPFGSTEGPQNGFAAPTAQASGAPLPRYRLGTAVLVGGGYEDFVNDNLRGMTGGGGAWNARLVSGLRQTIGVEAAYVGSSRSIDGLGLGNDATLMANGLEGVARANFPVELAGGRSLLEPFAFVGLGWQHYRLRGSNNTGLATVGNSDDVLTVPLGAGVEFGYGMVIADARFTYRQTYLNDLLRDNGGGRLSSWGATAQVGIQF